MVLIPGVSVTSADVATGPCGACTFGVHGRANEGRVQVDGLGQGASLAGTTSGLITDPGNAQEVNVTTSGGLGEAETSGPVMNFVGVLAKFPAVDGFGRIIRLKMLLNSTRTLNVTLSLIRKFRAKFAFSLG